MRVLAWTPRLDAGAAGDVELTNDLDQLLAESDYVSLHAPATPETAGLIGERELRAMKPTAYLVNTSRGALVDEDALVRALRGGLDRGRGAGRAARRSRRRRIIRCSRSTTRS